MARIPPGAYEEYLAQGTERSYQALADRYGVSKTAIVKKAKKERWQERIAELERKARERAEEKAVGELEAVRQRQLKESRFLLARSLQVLKSQPPEKGIRAASALAIAWKQELLLLGEPTERQANVEELIKRETRELLKVVDDGEHSKIATGHLLKEAEYPDSTSATDVVTYAYNAQGQEIYKKDQAGNVYETSYDTGGKRTHLRVTTLASGFDGAVRRISTTYTSLGQRELVTQYDNATVGSGSVVDEVKFSYDGWGNLLKFEQDRNSAVGASGSVDDYEVSYAYEKATAGRNTLRRSSMSLPDGTATTFAYLSTGSLHDEVASRVTRVKIGDTILAAYQYNGLDAVVGTLYDQPDVMWKLYGATSGTYPDLDRFNRVTSSRWTKDLATDVDFYDTDIGWDRNSNVTSVDEHVHAGFDALYTNDELNRLKRAEEGTLSGGSISSRTRDQQWTLTQTGNWELDKVDLNGDGDFVDANELNDDRTHNDVNELTARDTDDNGTNNYTLTYDAAGNLTDDGENYEYEWDAFYRLRKVKKTTDQSLVAEHKYNGLGYRISVHEDTDADGDVDASDKWFHSAYDERWRIVATFRESDSSPKEQFVNHNAGLGGYGTGSYIDLVILRDKDANTAWTSASDGTLEQRLYYCQNWRADVVALVASGGSMLEWVKYSAYGIPFGLSGGDTDSDGDCDAADVTQVQTWINAPAYDVRGDIDLDGDVDATDKSVIESNYQGTSLGTKVLTSNGVANRKGLAGYEADFEAGTIYLARTRVFNSEIGRWLSRDLLGYSDTLSLLEYCMGRPIVDRDPSGTTITGGGKWGGTSSRTIGFYAGWKGHFGIHLGDVVVSKGWECDDCSCSFVGNPVFSTTLHNTSCEETETECHAGPPCPSKEGCPAGTSSEECIIKYECCTTVGISYVSAKVCKTYQTTLSTGCP